MKRYLISTALAALLPGSALATQALDLETFDHAPAGIIQPGQIVDLEHFRVETALGTTAVIKPVTQQDELASGLALGALDNAGPASVHLWFDKPRQRLTFTIVLPPGSPALKSVAALYNGVGTQVQSLTIQHSTTGHRVRLSMSAKDTGSFDRLSLQLQRGAYIDAVEMTSPPSADATLIDFDELPSASFEGVHDMSHYIVSALSGAIRIEPSTDDTTSGQVLTSGSKTGNDVTLIYRTRRDTIDLTVVPDPFGQPATIAFLSGGAFAPVHTIQVQPTAGMQRLTYSAPLGSSLQGVRWTGGKLQIDDVTLRSK